MRETHTQTHRGKDIRKERNVWLFNFILSGLLLTPFFSQPTSILLEPLPVAWANTLNLESLCSVLMSTNVILQHYIPIPRVQSHNYLQVSAIKWPRCWNWHCKFLPATICLTFWSQLGPTLVIESPVTSCVRSLREGRTPCKAAEHCRFLRWGSWHLQMKTNLMFILNRDFPQFQEDLGIFEW